MIFNLEKYVPEFLSAGADILTIHVEATKDPEALLKEIRSAGCKAGITLRPGTSEDICRAPADKNSNFGSRVLG